MSRVLQFIGAALFAALMAWGTYLLIADFVRDRDPFHGVFAILSPVTSLMAVAFTFSFLFKPIGFFRAPKLDEGETQVWEVWANHTQGWRAVGGKLHLTSERVIFQANKFDHFLGGKDLSIARSAIAETGIAQRDFMGGPFSGGIRRRLEIDLVGGSEELFVVNRLDSTVSKLQSNMA